MLKYAFALMLAAGPALAQPADADQVPGVWREVGAFRHGDGDVPVAPVLVPPASAPAVSQVPPPASDSAISAIWVGPIVSITPQGAVKIYRWPGKPLECGLECGPTDISPVPMPLPDSRYP